jgi:hypothetical protein
MKHLVTLYGERYTAEANHRYKDNKDQRVLEIFDAENGMPAGVISVCVPSVTLQQNETILKATDCDGLLEAILASGIATSTGRQVRSGYSIYPVVRLTESFLKESDKVMKTA